MLSRIIVDILILNPNPIEQRVEVHVLQRISCTDACLALLRLLPLLLLAGLLTPANDCSYSSYMQHDHLGHHLSCQQQCIDLMP